MYGGRLATDVYTVLPTILLQYSLILYTKLRTPIELLSSIIGLAGLIGAFGIVFSTLDGFCFQSRHLAVTVKERIPRWRTMRRIPTAAYKTGDIPFCIANSMRPTLVWHRFLQVISPVPSCPPLVPKNHKSHHSVYQCKAIGPLAALAMAATGTLCVLEPQISSKAA